MSLIDDECYSSEHVKFQSDDQHGFMRVKVTRFTGWLLMHEQSVSSTLNESSAKLQRMKLSLIVKPMKEPGREIDVSCNKRERERWMH